MAKQRYHVVFERIGRNHGLSGDFEAADAAELADAIYRFARKHLASRDFAVVVDLEKKYGLHRGRPLRYLHGQRARGGLIYLGNRDKTAQQTGRIRIAGQEGASIKNGPCP